MPQARLVRTSLALLLRALHASGHDTHRLRCGRCGGTDPRCRPPWTPWLPSWSCKQSPQSASTSAAATSWLRTRKLGARLVLQALCLSSPTPLAPARDFSVRTMQEPDDHAGAPLHRSVCGREEEASQARAGGRPRGRPATRVARPLGRVCLHAALPQARRYTLAHWRQCARMLLHACFAAAP